MQTIVYVGDGVQTRFEVPGSSTVRSVYVSGTLATQASSDTSSVTLSVAPAVGAPVQIDYLESSQPKITPIRSQRVTPLTGATVTVLPLVERLVVTPAGTIATLTVVLPAAADAVDGEQIEVQSSQTVTALTVTSSGASAVAAPSTIGAAQGFTLRYDAVATRWWRV